MADRPSTIYVGLGSNLGDRADNLRRAVLALREAIDVEQISSIWLTEPVGYRDQPAFYNAVLRGHTALGSRALLEALLAVERWLGRDRRASVPMGPRTIDLDLLLHGDERIDEPGLVVPHPRMATRKFVLAPLAEIAPALRIGTDGRSAAELLAALGPGDEVERLAVEGWPPT